MNQRRHLVLLAAVVALITATTAAPTASGAVNYSPLYWELLDRYASAELPSSTPARLIAASTTAILPRRGVCEEVCGDMITLFILTPDGSFRPYGAWIEDPAALDGWRLVTSSDCQAVGWLDFTHPHWWACWGVGYL